MKTNKISIDELVEEIINSGKFDEFIRLPAK